MHFREHFRERVRGSNFAVRMLCACLMLVVYSWLMVAWTTTSQPLIGSNSQEYVTKKASINGRRNFWLTVGSFLLAVERFPRSAAIQMGGVLQYKWEAYCDTNGRSTDSISLSSERRGSESTAIQIGGVLQYKLEVYFDTFLRSSGG